MVASRAHEEEGRVLDPALVLLSPLVAAVDVIGAGARAPVPELRRLDLAGETPGAPQADARPGHPTWFDPSSEVPYAWTSDEGAAAARSESPARVRASLSAK